MYAMFVKEMQQFFRGIISKIVAGMIFLAWLLLIFAARSEVPELEVLQKSDIMVIMPKYQIFLYALGLIGIGVTVLVIMLGSSAGRWRMELGDPAFSPGITTCTPAWQLALGKWSAMIVQAVIGVAAGCLLPLKIFIELKSVKNLCTLACQFSHVEVQIADMLADLAKLGAKAPVIALCFIVALSSTALAVCSLKPRSRGKYDIGSLAVVVLLGVQSFSMTVGISPEHFAAEIIARTVIITVGSLALISSGVSAPGANRLFFFKIWVFFSVFAGLPAVHWMSGEFSRTIWAVELLAAALFFIGCSLFERLIQSRRVLAQMSDPLKMIAAFPFSTGALNSMVLSGIFIVAAYNIQPEAVKSVPDAIYGMVTLAALCNLAGLFFEKAGKRFIRLGAFLGGGWLAGFLIGLINVEYPDFLEENQALIRGAEVVLTGISLLILAINYNCRKKDL